MIDHYRQLKNLLEAEGPCFIGDPDLNVNPPYTFIWGITGAREARALSRQVNSLSESFKISCVAATGNNALSLAERVIGRVKAAELIVPGWRTFPFREREIGFNGPFSQRGVVEEPTNRYPSLVVLDVRLRATKE